MKGRFKYVIVLGQGVRWAVLFPEAVNHCDAVNRATAEPLSAGFCTVNDASVLVDGRSESLDLDSQPADAQIIADSLALMGLRPLTREALQRRFLRIEPV